MDPLDSIPPLSSPEVLRDPYPVYHQLRELGPLVRTPRLFDGAWLVTRYREVRELFADTEHLSSDRSRSLVDTLPEAEQARFSTLLDHHRKWMVFADPPAHTRVRRELNHAFTGYLRAGLEDAIRTHVDHLIDQFVDRGEVEFASELARPLPLMVVGALLGIEAADYSRFAGWTRDLAAYMGLERADPEILETAQLAIASMQRYFGGLFDARRERPEPDDFITTLVRRGVLADDEITAQCAQLAFAGNETTRNLIVNTLHCLLRHPEQLEIVSRDLDMMAAAVEETLRYESPVQFIGRVVGRDFEYAGQQLRAGECVMLMIGSANRDPRANADPERFDLTRSERVSVSFGHGVHGCIGSALSKREAFTALARCFSRCGAPQIGGSVRWRDNPGLRGLVELRLRFGG